MMREKEKFERKKEKITEDLTWRERKTRWKLQEIARSEEEGGRKVWVRQSRIRINKQWWKWDKEEEVLRQKRGNVKGGKQGTEIRGKVGSKKE